MERTSHRFDFARAESHERRCDHQGCEGDGLYRAPVSARKLNEYHWFCLDHVREYNKAWNFCSGLTQTQIEAMIRADTTWERPTRPMSHWRAYEYKLRAAAEAYAEGNARPTGDEWARRQKKREADTPEAAALRLFGLTPPVDYAAIRGRYIELVKETHPDANHGSKESEELLKLINQALQTLKKAYLA
jgi:DnaJ-domain-containing protein 1